MSKRALAFGVGIALLASAAGASQSGQHIDLDYTVRVGGFKVGVIGVDAEMQAGSYKTTMTVQSKGLAKWFSDFTINATAVGTVGDVTIVPAKFERTTVEEDKTNSLQIDFTDGTPDRMLRTPKDSGPEEHRVPDQLRRGTFDPLSAIVALLAPTGQPPCERTIPIYDGRKRFDIELTPVAPREGDPADLLRCSGQPIRVAGFKEKHLRKPPLPPVEAKFRVVDGGRYYLPIRLTMHTNFGAILMMADRHEVGPLAVRAASAELE